MGCGCGSRRSTPTARPTPTAREGDWVVTYPSGRTQVYSGRGARRAAQREALATGGAARQV